MSFEELVQLALHDVVVGAIPDRDPAALQEVVDEAALATPEGDHPHPAVLARRDAQGADGASELVPVGDPQLRRSPRLGEGATQRALQLGIEGFFIHHQLRYSPSNRARTFLVAWNTLALAESSLQPSTAAMSPYSWPSTCRRINAA